MFDSEAIYTTKNKDAQTKIYLYAGDQQHSLPLSAARRCPLNKR